MIFAPWLELIPLDLGDTLVLVVLAALVLPVLHTATCTVDWFWNLGRRLRDHGRKKTA